MKKLFVIFYVLVLLTGASCTREWDIKDLQPEPQTQADETESDDDSEQE